MNKKKFNIWFGAALLLGMLGVCYAAIDAIYSGEAPTLPEDYVTAVLSPVQE